LVTASDTVSACPCSTGSGVAVSNLSVEGIVPVEANTLVDNTTTGGGVCGPFGFNNCPPGTRIMWNIPVVNPGQTATVTMPPTIRADIPAGTVVRLVGRLVASIGTPPVQVSTAVTVN
jgi:hypothetical protein